MKKLILTLGLATLVAAPALAGHGRQVAKVDSRAMLTADGYVPRQFSWDDGFFSYRGGGVSVRGGKAGFDYDRSYPYDYAYLGPAFDDEEQPERRMRTCEERPVRGPGGREDYVRICRD